jgi:hypothetical protein
VAHVEAELTNPPRNFLDVHKQVYHREFPDVNVVLG